MKIAFMPARAVLDFVDLLESHQIEVILDGGWAVDAQLGYQSRDHQDLDVAVFHRNLPAIRTLLEERGFVIVPRDDSWECNFVYGNTEGHLIDIHSCSFDKNKKHSFGVPYTWESLSGFGEIQGKRVRCIPPEILVKYHTGYKLDENDYHDVKLLCQKFNLKIPVEYTPFQDKEKSQSN